MDIILKIPLDTANDLLAACKRGERSAQKQLYELFYNKMMMVCLRYAANREEAKDLLNEGFLKVFLNIHKFQPNYTLESWIRRIMVNNAIDNYRRTKKHRYQTDIDEVYDHSEDEVVSSQLSANEIMKLVNTLSPAYKAVFNLFAIEGFSHKEIAAKLGISEGTSKSNLSKARAKLKVMLKKREIIK